MKRRRESSIEYEIHGEIVVLKYDGKQYAWYPPINGSIDTFLNQQTFQYDIVHTITGEAIFTVENLRTDTDVLRQKVNPMNYEETV